MTFGSNIKIRPGRVEDIDAIKSLADAHKHELGFLRRPSLMEAIERQGLLLAQNNTDVIGFVEYRHRRDQQTTLYNIVIHPNHRGQGTGYQLVLALEEEAKQKEKSLISLKCPEDLLANGFYEHVGYKRIDVESGKSRRLNIWQKVLA